MNDDFTIYIDRLSQEKQETFDLTKNPADFLVCEEALSFVDQVKIKGKAYIAQSHLVIHADIEVNYEIPCNICNQRTVKPLSLSGQYYTISLDTIKGKIFDFGHLIRETILLEVPHFSYCHETHCPEEETIKKYLTKNEEKSNYPFADLDR